MAEERRKYCYASLNHDRIASVGWDPILKLTYIKNLGIAYPHLRAILYVVTRFYCIMSNGGGGNACGEAGSTRSEEREEYWWGICHIKIYLCPVTYFLLL